MTRRRRGRGEGSIYQRDDGLWVGSVSVGYDGVGRRKRRVAYGKTKMEVQQRLGDLGKAMATDVAKLSLGDFLTQWVENTVRASVAPTTKCRYEQIVRLHLAPHIGHLPLAKFGRLHFQQLFAKHRELGISRRNQAMATTVLHTALGYAASDAVKLIPHNPLAGLRDRPKYERDERPTWKIEEAKRFLQAAAGDRYYALYAMAVGTGMREGELFALTWRDIDFPNAVVVVTKTLEELSGKLRVKEPKTKAGRRRIDLPQFVMVALHEHRKRMLAEGYASAPVFCDTNGGYLRRSNFRRRSFLRMLELANRPIRVDAWSGNAPPGSVADENIIAGEVVAVNGGTITVSVSRGEHRTFAVADSTKITLDEKPCSLADIGGGNVARIHVEPIPELRFHDLRHTAATLLLSKGENPKVVSERLGHTKVQTTLDIYAHVSETMQREAAAKMDRMMA